MVQPVRSSTIMRSVLRCVIGLCVALAGCRGPVELAWNTIVVEPALFCVGRDMAVMHSRHYRLATTAWQEIADGQPGPMCSDDYECGFKDGFADYLDAGGSCEPPTLPPRRYWRSCYRTPEGHRAIQDWFAGFRYGAACARDSGLRHFAVIPSSALIAPPPGHLPLPETMPPPQEIIPAPMPSRGELPAVNRTSATEPAGPTSQP